jgi:Xaa-Pro aminopeptidase
MSTDLRAGAGAAAGAAADAALRAARRDRVFDALDAAGLDVLVLSRRDAIAYACGVRKLWTAGTRPFSASCVLVAASRSVHLLSTWDEGVPPEVPFEHLYGLTWNPAVMERAVGAVPGFTDARRIGVDGLGVGFAGMARRLVPGVELVPADDLLHGVRAVKLPAEIDRLRVAGAVAAAAVDAAAAALAGGDPPAAALTAALLAAADRGVTVPSSAPRVTPAGRLVQVDVGVLVDDYEGGRGRTVALTGASGAVDEVHARLVAACRAGATAADVRAAGAGADGWQVRGSGMGFEPPVLTAALGTSTELRAGMVLSVAADLAGAHRRDLVHVTPTTPEVL